MEKSTYELITDLCDKHIDKRKCIYESINIQPIIKKLRVKAFEILLKKQPSTSCFNELEDNSDPICHLLAWQYTLKNELDQPERAEELNIFTNKLKDSEMMKDPIVQNMVLFLLYLRGSKQYDEKQNSNYNIFDKVVLKHKSHSGNSALPYDLYQEHKFHFATSLIHDDHRTLSTFSPNAFVLKPSIALRISKSNTTLNSNNEVLSYSTDFKFPPLLAARYTSSTSQTFVPTKYDVVNDEGYESPIKETINDMWENASKMPINEHKNWESLDKFDPIKELTFACESGSKTLHYFQKIIDANTFNLKPYTDELNILNCVQFIKNVKYMLVGMTSDVFLTNDKNMFYLRDGVTVEGVSTEALKSYCVDLLFCGSCYRSLNELCTPCPTRNKERYGYIFKELCESIQRYLAYYKVAALSVPDTATLLTVHTHMHQLKDQISAFARICKVAKFSIYTDENQVPQGVELLNYLYQEITRTIDKNIVLVLYSAFYPCCQIYFSRFLQRWLFEGVLIDPYEEFFVKSELTYTNSRARTYWTRSFSLRHHAIPDFLTDFKNDILQCGKTMNLLKLCKPDASLYTHILARSLPLISCCLTTEHSRTLRQEIDCYYIEMASLCGPRISLYHKLRERYEENLEFLSLIEKKRAITFKKIELQKQNEAEEKAKHKRKILEELLEQIRLAREYKKQVKEEELQKDLVIAKQNADMEELRAKLLKEETKAIIKYYNSLIEAVDKRRTSIIQRTQQIKEKEKLDEDKNIKEVKRKDKTSVITTNELSEKEAKILELPEDENKNLDDLELITTNPKEKSDLDEVNANIENATNNQLNNHINETFLAARRNKAKILNLEFDTSYKESPKTQIEVVDTLTEAQRNKNKVLSSEYDILKRVTTLKKQSIKNEIKEENGNAQQQIKKTTLVSENNRNTRVNKPIITLTPELNDIDLTQTKTNLASPGHEDVMNIVHRKKMLTLPNDLLTVHENEILSPNDAIPMSVDSTPNTENPETPVSTILSLCTDAMTESLFNLDSALLTTNSNITDDGFKFPNPEPKKFVYENATKLFVTEKKNILSITENIQHSIRPMRLSKTEVKEIKNSNLKLLLHQSVHMPLAAQIKLVNNEILKHFIIDQNFFSHLHSLRCYYFLLDGEFGRHITDGLFNKLYEAKNPADLLNCRFLQVIINKALYASSKVHENAELLSFIVQTVPQSFDLSSADVLECLSLSYRINWPLNILLPCDTIEKYDHVFKYLLKLHHVSWILQKMFQELKFAQKEQGIAGTILMQSPQYHKIQFYRHIMTHFIQTLQNYTVSEVIQTSWEELENNMKTVTTLDQLYTVHILYVKTIMFRCLLNKKCAPIMKVIHEIFVVILKFYNYLKSRSWSLKKHDLYFTHPNFKKLEDIFHKFEEFTYFVFRVGNKMARVGYQPHLVQMLDMLNMNAYYTNKQKK